MSSRPSLLFDAAAAAGRALGVPPHGWSDEALLPAAGAAWEKLDDAGRAVVAALVELGGSAGSAVLLEEATDATGDRAAVDRALEAAWESGLVARDRASRTFFLLPEVAAAFAPRVRASLVAQLQPLAAAPMGGLDAHVQCCALNLLRHEPLKLTREGTPFRRGLETFAERLRPLLPQPEREALQRSSDLLSVLRDSGLLRQTRDALETDIDAVERWADESAAQRALRLLPPDARHATWRLLRMLRDLGPDHAWPVALAARELRRLLRAVAEDEPAEPLARGDEDSVFGAAVSDLERAGLLARLPGERIALTSEGRAFPDESPLPRPKGAHVGHDLAVLVPRGLEPAVHARLGDVAKLETADQVARYRLDRAAVLEALDRGATAAQLELFLAENATPVLPDTVRDDVRRWAERFGEVTSRAGICVSCSASRRHEEFDAVVRRCGLSVALVAPGIAVVAPEDHGALCLALAAAGLTPRRRLIPLVRGPASAAPPHAPPRERALSVVDVGTLAQDLASMPSWGSRFRAQEGRKAAPPPRLVAAQVKEKYRREFGSGQLASLDRLEIDELMALEDKGLVRQFLAGKVPAPSSARGAADIDEYFTDELVSVTPARARQVLEQVARASLSCQLAYLQGPGRTQRLVVSPLEIVSDGAGTYVRARVPGSAHERMFATDRIHALRVISPAARAT